jgi:ribosomal protein L19
VKNRFQNVPFKFNLHRYIKVEVLENRRRANYFTGICIARKNRGIGVGTAVHKLNAVDP